MSLPRVAGYLLTSPSKQPAGASSSRGKKKIKNVSLTLKGKPLGETRGGKQETKIHAQKTTSLPPHAGSCPLAVQNRDKCFQQTFCPIIKKS